MMQWCFFLFGIRLVALEELGEFDQNQSSMNEGQQFDLLYNDCDSDQESLGCEFESEIYFGLVFQSKQEKNQLKYPDPMIAIQ